MSERKGKERQELRADVGSAPLKQPGGQARRSQSIRDHVCLKMLSSSSSVLYEMCQKFKLLSCRDEGEFLPGDSDVVVVDFRVS